MPDIFYFIFIFFRDTNSYDEDDSEEGEWKGIENSQINSDYGPSYTSGSYHNVGYQTNPLENLYKSYQNAHHSNAWNTQSNPGSGYVGNAPYPVPYHVPLSYPVPLKIRQPLPIQIPVPIPLERTVTIPVEKTVPFPVERPVPYPVIRNIPVPVSQPYPVPVPVYRTKIVVHGKSYD